MSYLIDIIIILVLIIINGLFAMAEFAIVSARKTRLRQWADGGDTRAAAAITLAEEPTPFLSTVQIGITLVGIFAGAFGGATVAAGLAGYFRGFLPIAPYGDILGIALVVVAITYLTLIFGELIPKRIALTHADAIAVAVAKPMQFLAVLTAPLVIVLSGSTETVLRVLRIGRTPKPPVSEEDIRTMLAEGTRAGIFGENEREMIEGVFGLAGIRAGTIMTPRLEIIALNPGDPFRGNLKIMTRSGRSHFPVCEGDLDTVLGMVSVRDVLAAMADGGTPDIRALCKKPLFVPSSLPILNVLERFKKTGLHHALVTDEYGSIAGIITLHDILEEVVGDIRSIREKEEKAVVKREDGTWLIGGDMEIEDLGAIFPAGSLPEQGKGPYRTIAGLVLFHLERIPVTGDHFESGGLRFEVVDMDGSRIDKVLVSRISP